MLICLRKIFGTLMYFMLFLPLSLQSWSTYVLLTDYVSVTFCLLSLLVLYACVYFTKWNRLLLLYGHQQIPINIVIKMSGNGQLLIIKVRIMSRTHMYSERLNWYDTGISQNHKPKFMSRKQLNPKNRDCHREAHCCYMMALKVYPTETTFKIPAPDL